MSYFAEKAKQKEASRQLSQQKHDEYLLTISNDDTNADELLKFFRWLLLPFFFIWVAYIGHIYLTHQLTGTVSEEAVFAISIALPLVIQTIKAYCATKCLRAFHFKWYDKSAQDFWLWLCMAILVVFAFVWTLKISFWDVKTSTREAYIEKESTTLQNHVANATAGIDSLIISLQNADAQAGNMRTKAGKINWAIQPIKAENAKTLASLNQQRQDIITAATADFKEKKATTKETAQNRGNFFQRSGGFGEVGEIICLLILGLLEARLRNANAPRFNPPPPQQQQRHFGATNGHQAPQNMYFNRQPNGQVRNALDPHPLFPPDSPHDITVSQPYGTVTQQNINTAYAAADAILKLAEKELRGFAANFDRRQGNNHTVSGNINRILDETYSHLMAEGFTPSREQGAKFYGYLMELFPKLREKGWPYDRDSMMGKKLLSIIPEREVETA